MTTVLGILAGVVITVAVQTVALLLWQMRAQDRRDTARHIRRDTTTAAVTRLFTGPEGGTR